MRRFFAILIVTLLMSWPAQAQKEPCAVAGNNNEFLGIQTIRLWPGDAPEAKGTACEDTPTLTIFEPAHGLSNGSAVVIMPGGSYLHLAANHEGRQVADWFTTRGFRAFILSYRLASHGYLVTAPQLDARRAVQTVRARARDYQVDPNKIVVIGFSAGGHLAALTGTTFIPGNPEAEDPIERVSSRPDYLVLGYPWIGALSESDPRYMKRCKTDFPADKCEALRTGYSPELLVNKGTPPTFLYHTFNDQAVPVEQGLSFYEALVKAGVPSEMHIFPNGPHGVGLGKGDAVLDQWPALLESWLRAQGLLTQDKSAVKP
jgi:acetyl esterase/lipase